MSLKTIKLLFGILLLFLTSCNHSFLTVQTDYITHKNLASYYVDTPDPRQNLIAIGQRLIISWSIPKAFLAYENLHLKIFIRFRNKEEQIEVFPISKTRGTYLFLLLNEEYLKKRGILTYKVYLSDENCILEEWRHLVWVELLSINDNANAANDQFENNPCEKELLSNDQEEEYLINWDTDF